MSPKHYRNFDVTFLIVLSLFGLLLIAGLATFPPIVTGDISWRKPLVGSIFSSICILGILAVFSPTHCLKILELQKKENPSSSVSGKFATHRLSSPLQGHHPSCGRFSTHIFRIGRRTFCAACVGLFFGGLLALTVALLYFFGNWYIAENGSLIVLLGILGVGLGLSQFKFRNLVRLSLNTLFVLGTLFILIGIDKIIHSLIFDLFVVSLTLFWLYTRISISQWDHKRICADCNIVGCEMAE